MGMTGSGQHDGHDSMTGKQAKLAVFNAHSFPQAVHLSMFTLVFSLIIYIIELTETHFG